MDKMVLTALLSVIVILATHSAEANNLYADAMYTVLSASGRRFVPLTADNKPVNLTLGLSLLDIKVVEDNLLAFDLWFTQTWMDDRLAYKDINYKDSLHIPVNDIWIPDITSFSGSLERDTSLNLVALDKDGTLTYVPRYRHLSYCKLGSSENIACEIKLGSWVYSGNFITLNINSQTVDLSEFSAYSRFNVIETSLVKHTNYYPCCPEPYEDVTAYLNITLKADPESDENAGAEVKVGLNSVLVASLVSLLVAYRSQ